MNSSAHHRTVVFWDILLKLSRGKSADRLENSDQFMQQMLENLPTAKNDLSWRAAALSTGSVRSSVTSQQPSTAVFAFSEEVASCASLGMAVISMCLSPEDTWCLYIVRMVLDTSGAAM